MGSVVQVSKNSNKYMKKKNNKLNHKNNLHFCGICGESYLETEMERDICSYTGWLCYCCFLSVHPEYEEFGEY